jgi:phosphopantetheine adenylyltransferase
MAKSKVSKKEESNQDKFGTAETFEGDMERMSKMKYADFRKEATGLFSTIHDAMIENIHWYAKDRDGYLDVIAKGFELRDEKLDEVIKNIDERLRNVVRKMDMNENQKRIIEQQFLLHLALGHSLSKDEIDQLRDEIEKAKESSEAAA